jgi:putative DNA primase/helicase
MTVAVDEDAVREFITIVSEHAAELAKSNGKSGVLQLTRLSPADEKLVPTRFKLDSVDDMVRAAIADANASHNVYIEGRTVRADLRGAARGTLADTEFVFGLVVDVDRDKGKGGAVTVRPSLTIETSPGNLHLWYLLTQPLAAGPAKALGDAIRVATGTDQDTGVVSQPYRVPGTPNFPSKAKRARGRLSVEPTRIVEHSGRLWGPDELKAAFAAQTPAPGAPSASARRSGAAAPNEASLPTELLQDIRDGGVSLGVGAKADKSRSGLFHRVIAELKKRRWTVDEIHALLERYPNGVAAKYVKRLREEVTRSYGKVENGSGAPVASSAAGSIRRARGGGLSSPPPPPSSPTSPPGAAPSVHVLPTIRLQDGQLTRAVAETEAAMQAAGIDVYARAGTLVYPVGQAMLTADGDRVITAKLGEFTTDSFIEPVAESAVFQRWSVRRHAWVDVDPPLQLVRMVLSRERKWGFPRVAGIITTPTLRADGSLLDTPGYDAISELYLMPGIKLPPIPPAPTREEGRAALKLLKDELFSEFSFKQRRPPIDLAVALAGLLTALLRGSLPTAPIVLITATAPGTGKSYLVDVISTVATGHLCPVITTSRNSEETEKRIGAVLLSGSTIVSLDNLTHDLESEILCHVAERPVVRVRILGRSEMPLCECRTALFATGNNVAFKGDMVRRGILCRLEALEARPELHEYQNDVLARIHAERGKYVAAALTAVRAYLAAGSPKVCSPFGSYYRWDALVRSPLVWLSESDPVDSIEEIRKKDQTLSELLELFSMWEGFLLLDMAYTAARIIEIAEETTAPPSGFRPELKAFLLKVATARGNPGVVSPKRLGKWLGKNSGRVVDMPPEKRRLVHGQDRTHVATFCLTKDV